METSAVIINMMWGRDQSQWPVNQLGGNGSLIARPWKKNQSMIGGS